MVSLSNVHGGRDNWVPTAPPGCAIISDVNLARRTLLGTGLAATAATLTGCDRNTPTADAPAWAEPVATEEPLAFTGGAAGTVRPTTSAKAASSVATPVGPPYAAKVKQTLTKYLKPTPDNTKHPGYAGAVTLVLQDGKTQLTTAVGHALRYKAGPVELPATQRVAMRTDSIFDLASLTKVYTAILTLQQVDRGKIDLDAPVQQYLPEFTGTGKDKITIAMLLAHTSALSVPRSPASPPTPSGGSR